MTTAAEFRVTFRFAENNPESAPRTMSGFQSIAHVTTWAERMGATTPVEVLSVESCQVTRTPWVLATNPRAFAEQNPETCTRCGDGVKYHDAEALRACGLIEETK